MNVCCDLKKVDSDTSDIYTMSVNLAPSDMLTGTSLSQTFIGVFKKIVISPTDTNIHRYTINFASKGDLGVMKRIYWLLGFLGVLVEILALTSIFIFPVIDPNIAKVLLPMGMAFLLMVGVDYIVRGKEHE